MNANLATSATRLINSAQQKSAYAAKELATVRIQNNSADSTELNSIDRIKPMLSLKTAELEISSAVKLLETDHATLGALLDIKA